MCVYVFLSFAALFTNLTGLLHNPRSPPESAPWEAEGGRKLGILLAWTWLASPYPSVLPAKPLCHCLTQGREGAI